MFESRFHEGRVDTCVGLVIQALLPAMGSSLSEALCSLVACHFETLLELRILELTDGNLLPPVTQRAPEWTRSIGHADDLPSQSKVHCTRCLHRVQ